MKALHIISTILLIIGGLNWGLIGLNLGWSLESILPSSVLMIVYILVGLAAIYEIFTHKKYCKVCGGSM